MSVSLILVGNPNPQELHRCLQRVLAAGRTLGVVIKITHYDPDAGCRVDAVRVELDSVFVHTCRTAQEVADLFDDQLLHLEWGKH